MSVYWVSSALRLPECDKESPSRETNRRGSHPLRRSFVLRDLGVLCDLVESSIRGDVSLLLSVLPKGERKHDTVEFVLGRRDSNGYHVTFMDGTF